MVVFSLFDAYYYIIMLIKHVNLYLMYFRWRIEERPGVAVRGRRGLGHSEMNLAMVLYSLHNAHF